VSTIPPQSPWAPRGRAFTLYAIAVTVLPADLTDHAAVEHAADWDRAAPGEIVTALCGIQAFAYPAGGTGGPWRAPWPLDPTRACLACVRVATGGRL
jgi:hypothetical protein